MAYDMLLKNKNKYVDNARLFERVFGVKLKRFWDGATGFDVIAFDEEFIKPAEGQSCNDAVLARYGQVGVDLIKELI